MTIATRLRAKMTEKRLGENELSRRSNVPQPTIHRILHGDSNTPRKATVEKLARSLAVTPEWLLFGSTHGNVTPIAAPYRMAREYPLISWVTAGAWTENDSSAHAGISTEMLFSHENPGDRGYWLEVKGDSMTPVQGNGFTPGMRILIQPEGFDLISGKFYVAKLMPSGDTTLKQYVRDAGTEFLKPLNPLYPMITVTDDVQIIGRVIDSRLPASFL